MRSAKPTDAAQTAAAMRDRVTVDRRGIRPQLQAQAAKRQMTTAALVRRAVTAMLDDAACEVGDNGPIESAIGTPVVKVTLRLPVAHAVVLASRARMADVSQGTYLARLIDGTPAQPRAPDHTQAVATLMASTDYVDATIGCLREAGFSYAMADHAWNALDSYVYGFTLQKLNFRFEPQEYAKMAKAFLPMIPAAQFPYLNGLSQQVIDGQHDGLHGLEFGLDLILDGLDKLRRKA